MMLPAVALGALALSGCPHDAALGSVTFVREGLEHQVSLADCRDRVLGKAHEPQTASSPLRVRGGVVAVRGQALWLVGPGGAARRLTPEQPGQQVPDPLTVSPDGRYLVWASVYDHASSANADGTPVEVTDVTPGGQTHVVAQSMLRWPDYLSWCGSSLVLVAGSDRIAIDGKRLVVASAPDWRPRSPWPEPSRTFGSVACAPDGRSVAVLSQASSTNAGFFAVRWQLWRVGLDGSRTRLAVAPKGFSDESPRWSRDGRSLLFVRERRGHGALWLWRGGRVTGPIARLGYDLGYYGHHDWWTRAEWHQPA